MAQPFTGSLDPTQYNDPKLDAYATKVEADKGLPSGFLMAIKNGGERSNATSVSPAGAQGVMQFMPETWKQYGKGRDIRDPYASIDAAGDMAVDLLKQYHGSIPAALAHYNGGNSQGALAQAGKAPTSPETFKYLQNTAKFFQPKPEGTVAPFIGALDAKPATEFTGQLDTPQGTPMQPKPFTGQLDKPIGASPTDIPIGVNEHAPTGNPTIASTPTAKDTSLLGQAKESASSTAKLIDLVGSAGSMAAGYLGGGVAGLATMDPTVAKNVKDEIMSKLSLDKALQTSNLATENAEPFTGALDTILGKPATILANTVSTPGTFVNDALRDAAMVAIPLGAHKGATALADHYTGGNVLPEAHEAPQALPRGQQSELFPEIPAQEGPIAPEPVTITPPKLSGLVDQAREASNPKPFYGKLDEDLGVQGTPEVEEAAPIQGQLFPEESPENNAYPNQTPAMPFTGELDTPHPNVVEPWTTGETYLGPETPQYSGQNELHINPLDDLVTSAQKAAEPLPETAPIDKVAQINTEGSNALFKGNGEQQAFGDTEPSFLFNAPEQVGHMLDIAGDTSNEGVTPTKAQLETQRDRQILMSPDNIFKTFGINEDTIKPLNGRTGEAYPNWYRRNLWNDNPILRGAYDAFAHISDKVNFEVRKTLEGDHGEHPTRNLETLNKDERWQYAQLKSRFEGRTSEDMINEGRNHFTEKEWLDRGATPKVAKALTEAGRIYDMGLKMNNARLEKVGQPQIKPIPNYFQHQLNGEFRVTTIEKKSGQQHVQAFGSLAEARKMAEHLNRTLPDGYAVDYKRAPRVGQSFHDLSEMLKQQASRFYGTDPSGFHNMIAAVSAKLNRARLGAKELRTGDMEYAGKHEFPEDAVGAQRQAMQRDADFLTKLPQKYMNDSSRFSKEVINNELMKAFKQAAEDHDVAHTQAWPQLQKIIREQSEAYTKPLYDNSKVSLPEKAVDMLSSMGDKSTIPSHTKQPAIGKQTIANATRGFGRLALWSKISPYMNAHLLPVQYLQHFLSVMGSMGEGTAFFAKNDPVSGIANQAIQLGKSPIKVMAAMVKAHYDTIAHMGGMADPKSTAALKWATEHGHLDTLISHDNMNLTKQATKIATGSAITQHAERTPRSMSFLTSYKLAKDLGFPEGEARVYAVRAMNQVMGDYTKAGKSDLIREEGPLIGSTLNQLSTFMINTIAQMETVGRGIGTHKGQFINSVALPIMSFLAVSYLATGWSGMPGIQDYDKLAKKLNDMFNLNIPLSFQLQMAHGPDVFGKHSNDAYYGAIPEATKRDIFQSNRTGSLFGFGQFLPESILDYGSEAYNEGKNALSKTGLVNPPTQMDLYRSRKAIIPPNFQFLYENAEAKQRPSPQGGPNDLILKEGIKRSGEDTDIMYHNPFTSLDEKKQRDINNQINYLKERQDVQTKKLITLMGDAADQHRPLGGLFQQLIALNPDYARNTDGIIQGLVENQIGRQLTRGEFEDLKAAKSTSLNDLQMAQKRASFTKQLLGTK
jgi:hypothetical protein